MKKKGKRQKRKEVSERIKQKILLNHIEKERLRHKKKIKTGKCGFKKGEKKIKKKKKRGEKRRLNTKKKKTARVAQRVNGHQ